jgi:hypothetical protein
LNPQEKQSRDPFEKLGKNISLILICCHLDLKAATSKNLLMFLKFNFRKPLQEKQQKYCQESFWIQKEKILKSQSRH